MKKQKHHPWLEPDEIHNYPELHSNPMKIRPVLIVVADREDPCIGWYFAGLVKQWRQDGSPSNQHPTHWMPMPEKPK